MAENVLFNGSVSVQFGKDRREIVATLSDGFNGQDKLYSYLVKNLSKDSRYLVTYMVSQNDRYNTIKVEEAIDEIAINLSSDNGTKRVVCYRQAPIDILIEVFEPLVKKLARQQKEYWQHLEIEDLEQICRLVICELSYKGYYIHKSIVHHCFNNAVLLSLRPERDKPQVISIHSIVKDTDCDVSITIGDTIEDESYVLDEEENDRRQFIKETFELVKDIVVSYIGPRQFDQLFRDYGYKHTTAQTRKMMQKIKAYFASLGITMEDFINKYYG